MDKLRYEFQDDKVIFFLDNIILCTFDIDDAHEFAWRLMLEIRKQRMYLEEEEYKKMKG